MPDLNLRNLDVTLVTALKAEAARRETTLRALCINLLGGVVDESRDPLRSEVEIPPRAAISSLLSIPGVRLGFNGPKPELPEVAATPVTVEMCEHTEWSGELGEQMHCGLERHSNKRPHGRWYKE